MKKILFFINTLEGGGAEKVLVDLLNVLPANKYELNLLTITGGVHENKLLNNVHYRKILSGNNCITRLLKKVFLKLPPRLFNFIFIRDKYDIEIAYLEGFPTRVIASRKSKAKKIAFVHCDVSVKPVLQKVYLDNKECLDEYKLFDSVVFVSNAAKEGFEKTFGWIDSSYVIRNVINTDEIISKAKADIDFSFNTVGLKIIAVGRLSEEKGFDRLVRIASELEKTFDFEICILGEGNQRLVLESLINELEVKSVRLLGYKDNPYAYMKKADVFVCSSLYEGYSTVVVEAVHLGLPVITTRCAGMDEILKHCNQLGVIVDNDETSLKEAMINVLSNRRLINTKNHNKVFCINNVMEEYYDLFDN